MQTATCRIKLNDKTITQLRGVTPAQAVILDKLHKANAGGEVILETVVTGNITGDGEAKRLTRMYGGGPVEKLWPGVVKKLPQTFAEAGFPVVAQTSVVIKPAPDDAPEEVPVPVTEAPVPVPESPAEVPADPAPEAKKIKVSKSKLV